MHEVELCQAEYIDGLFDFISCFSQAFEVYQDMFLEGATNFLCLYPIVLFSFFSRFVRYYSPEQLEEMASEEYKMFWISDIVGVVGVEDKVLLMNYLFLKAY